VLEAEHFVPFIIRKEYVTRKHQLLYGMLIYDDGDDNNNNNISNINKGKVVPVLN
jgi:hypothetical protein